MVELQRSFWMKNPTWNGQCLPKKSSFLWNTPSTLASCTKVRLSIQFSIQFWWLHGLSTLNSDIYYCLYFVDMVTETAMMAGYSWYAFAAKLKFLIFQLYLDLKFGFTWVQSVPEQSEAKFTLCIKCFNGWHYFFEHDIHFMDWNIIVW